MDYCKPYGDPSRAEIFVIGHDPALHNSKAEAQYAFFLNLLDKPQLPNNAIKSEYNLANSTYSYIKDLTGNKPSLSLDKMYFTNLCNEFLASPENNKSTVLIPDDLADKGVHEIENTVRWGSFKVVVPMSLQVFYHLVRTGFVAAGLGDDLKTFLAQSQPISDARVKGVYKATVPRSFIRVCGHTFYHVKMPVVPIVHVMKWIHVRKEDVYYPLMQQAAINIQEALGSR